MKWNINSLMQRSLMSLITILGMARVDYKTLNQYILGINQKNNLPGMLGELAGCLKNILDYRMFAFAIMKDNELEIWIDPSVYRNSFRAHIESDFKVSKDTRIRYIIDEDDVQQETFDVATANIISRELSGQRYIARVYVAPERRMLPYHNDILSVIFETLSTAISNLVVRQNLQDAAIIDPLTKCYNRREFDKMIERHISIANRYNKDLSIFMMDIDYFKSINDTYGHQAGDGVLTMVADTLMTEMRLGDSLSRYGGEEFIAILPETNETQAIELAERLRKITEKRSITTHDGKEVHLTASFGIASLKKNNGRDDLIKEADVMLYQAKSGGRNLVMPRQSEAHA